MQTLPSILHEVSENAKELCLLEFIQTYNRVKKKR
jgi:hypothetical protein